MPTLQVDITGLSLWKFIGQATIEVLFPVASARNQQHVPMVLVTHSGESYPWLDLTGSILDLTSMTSGMPAASRRVIPPWMLPLDIGTQAPILDQNIATKAGLVCAAVRLPWVEGSYLEACSTLRGPVALNSGYHWVDCFTRWITEGAPGSLGISVHPQSGGTYPAGSFLGDLASRTPAGDVSIEIENHTVAEHLRKRFVPTKHGELLSEVGDLLRLTDAPGAATAVPVYFGREAWRGIPPQTNSNLKTLGGSSQLCPQASVAV